MQIEIKSKQEKQEDENSIESELKSVFPDLVVKED